MFINEYLSWIDHKKIVVNKVSKILELLYRAKNNLNKKITSFYYLFVHSYLTYESTA